MLHALGVAASERYNTLVEHEVRTRLGVTLVDETRGRNKHSVREIAGISRELRDSFSSRRASIEDAYETLVHEYVAKHGHTPPKTVQLRLAQRATLGTREGKSAPKSLSRQRAEWRLAAIKIIGEVAVDTIGTTVRQTQQLSVQDETLSALSIDDLAERVVRDEAWTHLASRLAAHEAHGADVRTRLAAAVRVEDAAPDSTVESFAKIYHHRLGAPAASAPETGLPSWVSPPPGEVDGDNRETRAWLHAQAELIHDRTQALVDTTTANPAPWSAKLRPAPDDASLQKAWRRDLGNVVPSAT